ncbi:sugar O-acetyltransferase [Treponema phagedenis]|uniref:Acetyltransferase n=1 Tax=Treponema phagedenis TaxID=162 RepID=A0A0B7GVJ7_TREPH|nr:sugar O-acetyltransferase [Treponema phagedenis]EFW36421.1 bacterial transferase hexapeptide repeat protein [Treponema phagedenis F0421]NVP22950.1 sugar O-acetyltransferase [Treponema phagedenis]QEJ95071.1 sugar O-acetyltransferase [Treponema phagedenis]QEJ98255.1 sugar O-acetyltransferase [Treponema phagedenis]QEK00996.1 sugar O-acetyltransferase [Treponema phagedenis]
MTEKEKMLRNILYDPAGDAALIADRLRSNELCHAYNLLLPTQKEERKALIQKLFGKTCRNFTIMSPFWCDYGYNIEVGENFYSNFNCTILDAGKVIFGDNVFIAPDCGFYTAGHPMDVARRNQGLEYAYPIIVGDNVWIGGGVRVMPGVTIGNNTIIGGGSVVVKSIPANVLAAGNPCRVIRPITETDSLTDFDKNGYFF